MNTNREEISNEELKSLTTAIKARHGIDFTNYEVKSLKRGIARLIAKRKLGSLLGLWSKVLKDKDYVLGCIDDLTVNLTELFRNPEFWTEIEKEVKQILVKNKSIKIWHAGCSSGEEVYSMTILLDKLLALRNAEILATDLSASILEKAQSGEYTNFVLRKYQQNFSEYSDRQFEDYFDVNGKQFTVKPKLQRGVAFKRHNLVMDPMEGQFDMIFCRNVMIYFDDRLKMKVLERFSKCLKPGGILVIGYYDILPSDHTNWFHVHHTKTRIYKKTA